MERLIMHAAVRAEVSPFVAFAIACVGASLILGRQRVSTVALTSLPESVAANAGVRSFVMLVVTGLGGLVLLTGLATLAIRFVD
ncbi:MAG: hypothetical protein JHC84_18725 [Solirubrobacteraceae bacterium]|nr:hypothetical protein [Solirubrobacteraceae bacterium]